MDLRDSSPRRRGGVAPRGQFSQRGASPKWIALPGGTLAPTGQFSETGPQRTVFSGQGTPAPRGQLSRRTPAQWTVLSGERTLPEGLTPIRQEQTRTCFRQHKIRRDRVSPREFTS